MQKPRTLPYAMKLEGVAKSLCQKGFCFRGMPHQQSNQVWHHRNSNLSWCKGQFKVHHRGGTILKMLVSERLHTLLQRMLCLYGPCLLPLDYADAQKETLQIAESHYFDRPTKLVQIKLPDLSKKQDSPLQGSQMSLAATLQGRPHLTCPSVQPGGRAACCS